VVVIGNRNVELGSQGFPLTSTRMSMQVGRDQIWTFRSIEYLVESRALQLSERVQQEAGPEKRNLGRLNPIPSSLEIYMDRTRQVYGTVDPCCRLYISPLQYIRVFTRTILCSSSMLVGSGTSEMAIDDEET
jgi:hypothetical protein